jgi:Flp pilus assembly protein CpaB
MTYRLRNILLAVVLAVLAAFLTALYVASYQNRVDGEQERVKVYVAKQDIAPGTSAADLLGKLEQEEVARKDLVPAWMSNPQQIQGQATSQWIYAGEQVTTRRFTLAGKTPIHAKLTGNFRAMAFPGTEDQLLAGVVRAGDHVDVVVSLQMGEGGGSNNVTRILLRDIEVLRAPHMGGVDSKLASSANNEKDGPYSVILKLTDSQAHKLYLVTAGNEDHEWWLDLRAPTDAVDSPESISTADAAARDGLPANQLQRLGGLNP